MAREFGASTAHASASKRKPCWEVELAEEPKDQLCARRWSPSWATSITARPRCSTPSALAQCGRTRSRRHHAAHRRVPSRDRTATRSSSSILPVTKRSPACVPAAPRSPTSSSWWSAADDGVMPQTLEAIDHAQGGQGADHCRDQQDRQARRPARTHQAAACRSRPAGRRLGRRHGHGAGFGQDQAESRSAARDDPAGGRHRRISKRIPTRPAIGTVLEAQAGSRPRSGGDGSGAQRHAARRRLLHLRLGFGKVRAMYERSRRSRCAKRSRPPGRSARSRFAAGSRATTSRWSPIPPRPSRSSSIREAKAREARWRSPAASRSSSCTSRCKEGEVKELNDHHQDRRGRHGGSADRDAAEALQREGQGPRLRSERRRHQRNRRAAGVGVERDHHRLQRPAGTQRRSRWRNRKRSTSACTRSFTN